MCVELQGVRAPQSSEAPISAVHQEGFTGIRPGWSAKSGWLFLDYLDISLLGERWAAVMAE